MNTVIKQFIKRQERPGSLCNLARWHWTWRPRLVRCDHCGRRMLWTSKMGLFSAYCSPDCADTDQSR